MLEATYWQYEKLNDKGKIVTAPTNDYDGKATGHYVFGVKQWLDENPAEARRLGWVKHIMHNIDKYLTYNKQTQYLIKKKKIIDEFTVEDEYIIKDKTEEMMARQEAGYSDWLDYDDSGNFVLWGG